MRSDFLKVDGVALPTPSTYKFSMEDLSSEATGRTLDGIMHKDVVATKDYYDCTWKKCSWEDAATILNATNGKTKVSLTYVDPRVPNRVLVNDFYIGKRSGAALNINDPNRAWSDISLTFIRI